MEINYKALVKTVHKTKNNEVYIVEEYLGIKSSKHKYRIRFAINGNVKNVNYEQIKNNSITFTSTKKKIKTKTKVKPNKLKIEKVSVKSDYGVFALDLATYKTGYAIFKGSNYIESGVISKSDKDKFKRINRMINEVMFRLKKHKIDIVVIEDIFLSSYNNISVTTFKALANIQGAIIDRLISEKYNYKLVSANEWRVSFFKGKNKREESKELAIEYVEKLIGKKLPEDESEAILIGIHELKKVKLS